VGRDRRRKAYKLERNGPVIRITIRGNMRPPSELRRMIRGGGWDSEGFRRKYFLSSLSHIPPGIPSPCPWTNGMVAARRWPGEGR
jgi:hypothetical protein